MSASGPLDYSQFAQSLKLLSALKQAFKLYRRESPFGGNCRACDAHGCLPMTLPREARNRSARIFLKS